MELLLTSFKHKVVNSFQDASSFVPPLIVGWGGGGGGGGREGVFIGSIRSAGQCHTQVNSVQLLLNSSC